MSVLETPRLYFTGRWTWDPIVTNNSPGFWDIATSKPTPPITDAGAYRKRIDDLIPGTATIGSNWNPQGTHRSVFYETGVRAVDRGDGRTEDDELVNVPVDFSSMLVDVNPYAPNTSQLFFDSLSVGIDGGPHIRMPNNGPAVGRYIKFGRNSSLEIAGIASVIWQLSCVDGLMIAAQDSAVLQQFQAAISAGDADGLTMRVNAYRTIYFNDVPPIPRPPSANDPRYLALQKRIRGGGFQPNPARSWLVGVIGLHRAGESAAMPGDRQLSGDNFGTAFARLDKASSRLVIDLGNSITETDPQATKTDLGPITVAAGSETLATLAYSDYDKAAYEKTSGLVTLALDAGQVTAVENGDLSLAAGGNAILAEQPLTAVVHPPNLYLEGATSGSVEVQVLRHGLPATETMLQVAEAQRTPVVPGQPGQQVDVVQTDSNGRAVIEFGTAAGATRRVFDGTSQWVLTPFDGTEPAPPNGVDWSRDCYVAIRVTPADDTIAGSEPTWENVYEKVLIDWEALAPCMDNWLRLGSEEDCTAMAPLIKSLTSLDHFNSFTYMPVTRGMSAGQRTLLHKWCDSPAPAAPRPPMMAAPDVDTIDEFDPSITIDLSRGFSEADDS